MAKVINENAFEVLEPETSVKAPAKRTRQTAKVDSKSTVVEKVKAAQSQVYVTFTNLSNRTLPFGGRDIEPNGTLRLHKAMGEALMQSEVYKQYERLVWIKGE